MQLEARDRSLVVNCTQCWSLCVRVCTFNCLRKLIRVADDRMWIDKPFHVLEAATRNFLEADCVVRLGTTSGYLPWERGDRDGEYSTTMSARYTGWRFSQTLTANIATLYVMRCPIGSQCSNCRRWVILDLYDAADNTTPMRSGPVWDDWCCTQKLHRRWICSIKISCRRWSTRRCSPYSEVVDDWADVRYGNCMQKQHQWCARRSSICL